ncbi:MAG: hypothetical protein PHP23_02405 [Desulfobacterales bacterium]|nr:hypothetical protein [Desulfobacterales bacterium]MDD4071104.1 hypothetical protein [Desulfobacterales bacterium]MDD4393553.1 hypothetical protein [Desulfobacterales bacterium]
MKKWTAAAVLDKPPGGPNMPSGSRWPETAMTVWVLMPQDGAEHRDRIA